MRPKHRTKIVNGAAPGIGAGVTTAFIERGYHVVANSLNITASTFAVTDRLAVVRGDIGDPSTARKIASATQLADESRRLREASERITRRKAYDSTPSPTT